MRVFRNQISTFHSNINCKYQTLRWQFPRPLQIRKTTVKSDEVVLKIVHGEIITNEHEIAFLSIIRNVVMACKTKELEWFGQRWGILEV